MDVTETGMSTNIILATLRLAHRRLSKITSPRVRLGLTFPLCALVATGIQQIIVDGILYGF